MRFKLNKKFSNVVLILLAALVAGFFDYPSIWDKGADFLNQRLPFLNNRAPHFYNIPFSLGLDLQGGTHLIYEADLASIKDSANEAMQGIRDVIERRVNLFGVTEPVVQINKSGEHYRLIVELAGVKDIKQAIAMIGETPALEFREKRSEEETENILKLQEEGREDFLQQDPYFRNSPLTGKYLKKSELNFDSTTYKPIISLEFDAEGSKIFELLTEGNIGQPLAIYLDGAPISAPTVQEKISGGRAQITGDFSIEEAKRLVRRLNAGALPVPIKLINQQSVGASLGEVSLRQSLIAGLIGLLAVAIFMIMRYSLPGFLAIIALLVYTSFVLLIFKFIPVTLTLAGIAGFILSVGMAVDANVLIFERMKEELKGGKSLGGAIDEGFKRAWNSIRDSNVSSLITCAILFWMGTSIIKGFALTLSIGILFSMLSAILITKTFLKLFVGSKLEKYQGLWK